MKENEKIIVALDVDTPEAAAGWTERLKNNVGYFKIGKQLFRRRAGRGEDDKRQRGESLPGP